MRLIISGKAAVGPARHGRRMRWLHSCAAVVRKQRQYAGCLPRVIIGSKYWSLTLRVALLALRSSNELGSSALYAAPGATNAGELSLSSISRGVRGFVVVFAGAACVHRGDVSQFRD